MSNELRLQSQKRFYLNQLGVAEWYARHPLVGATASRPLFVSLSPSIEISSALPAVVSNALVSKTLPDVIPTQVQAPRSARNLVSLMAGPERVSGNENSEPEVKIKIKVNEAEPLLLVQRPSEISSLTLPGNWLLVSNGSTFVLSDVNMNSQYSGEATLAENILNAIALAGGDQSADAIDKPAVLDVRQFAWPIFSNMKLPGNDTDTLFALIITSIESMLAEKDVRILVLGENAKKLLSDVVKNQWLQKTYFSSPASLSLMLNDPSLKSEFWLSVLESGFLQD